MDEGGRCGFSCPFCEFLIPKGLVAQAGALVCPQCGRALRVSRKFLKPAFVVLGGAIWLAWIWFSEGNSWWWALREPVVEVVGMVLVTLIWFLLPRQLVARYRDEDAPFTTLDISASDKPELDD